jgi:hypothetical protein
MYKVHLKQIRPNEDFIGSVHRLFADTGCATLLADPDVRKAGKRPNTFVWKGAKASVPDADCMQALVAAGSEADRGIHMRLSYE